MTDYDPNVEDMKPGATETLDGLRKPDDAVRRIEDEVSESSPFGGNTVVYARTNVCASPDAVTRQLDAIARSLAASGRRAPEPHMIFVDERRSGASTTGRDGLEAMLAVCRGGGVDVCCVEILDRLSRDLVELANISATLRHYGVELYEVAADGGMQKVDLFLEDADRCRRKAMGERARRGREMMLTDGRWPGGASFGYVAVPGQPGRIVPDEGGPAGVVRLAFRLAFDGMRDHDIAGILNEQALASPTGSGWKPDGVRRILRRKIYRGSLVFGETTLVEDPETGRKVCRKRPVTEWIVCEVPQLALVDPDVWDAVQK